MLSAKPVSSCARDTDPGCGSSYVAVTVQLPFGFNFQVPGALQGAPVLDGLVQFSENGVIAASIEVEPFSDQVHVVAVTHADGSPVSIVSPARTGEEIVVYAYGLGGPQPGVPAGQAPSSPVPVGGISVGFDWRPNALASRPPTQGGTLLDPAFAGFAPGNVGLYQINVVVPPPPAGTAPCVSAASPFYYVGSNLTIDIVGDSSFDGAAICVGVPESPGASAPTSGRRPR